MRKGNWLEAGTRAWWVTGALFFLVLELLLRIKLGSIFVLAGVWGLCHQWLAGKADIPRDPAPERRFFLALSAAVVFCVFIFLFFSILNIPLRCLHPEWRWFQLP